MILFCLLWSCVFATVHMKPFISCEKDHYSVNGLCCKKCSPGTKLVADCSKDNETQCQPCQEGEFQASWNYEKYCHLHRYCDINLHLKIQKEGSLEKDTICICTDGLHCTSPECESCSTHSPCQPGFGVKEKGTGTTDTLCESCQKGFFSNVSSASEECQPWTSCKDIGLVEIQEGTDKTDVICTEDLSFKEPRNKVLQQVCIPVLPQERRPEEVEEDLLPVQETLVRGQPVTQEDGKESRISEQEGQ
ncbi:tumor necrosis factor receptor superfamily member 5 isoform X2 [Dromiciops gliroides]|uniref:tumor necrosis factor receptor superfamily member 5 isoform X2 n=1 Tax=Dromiciops gliroides TaxID=33562 RepID=UPI001CC390F1|nr:tumor necrosis factor receptor superfamily member 5 isoform X2 [Dromiciops gliroides]